MRKQEQSGRRSRACVHCHMNAGEDEVQWGCFGAPADPMGFRPSVRDVKAQGVAKGQTSGARGDDLGLGVRVPGAEVGQR